MLNLLLILAFTLALSYGDDDVWTQFISQEHDENGDGKISTLHELQSLREFFLKEGVKTYIVNAAVANADDDFDGFIDADEYAELRMELLPLTHM